MVLRFTHEDNPRTYCNLDYTILAILNFCKYDLNT